MQASRVSISAARTLAVIGLCLTPYAAWPHCDSVEGPVVQDARLAIQERDPTPVLKWVEKNREGEVREAFEQTLAVRGTSDEARALADRYFFETLVRIHRAGEGEAFAGLKPADSVDPGIAAADKALTTGAAGELVRHLSAAVEDGIEKRVARVLERRQHAEESVEAGRQYVEAYVDYIHFVEALDRLVSDGGRHGHPEGPSSPQHASH